MQWSQLEKQVRERMHPSFRKRVKVCKAVYRREAAMMPSRAWISLDGTEIFEANDDKHQNALKKNREGLPTPGGSPSYPTHFLEESLHEFLNTKLADALRSENPIIRAFALLDEHAGPRALETSPLKEGDPALLNIFRDLRLMVEKTKE